MEKERKNTYIQYLIVKLILDYSETSDKVDPMDHDDERVVITDEGNDNEEDDNSEEDSDNDAHPNNIQPNNTTPSTIPLNIEFVSKMFYNFVNYRTSFVQNVPGTPEQVVQTWVNYFHQRINENPNFWKEEK
ncbi:unnamed protein product [Rotaria sp. Silwood2]|nr:unnamed protein product [Rotaria sp. Silwood2]CAF3004658.1 unnamed protein product [Rotaria sp. Silwood2]CAF3049937.1 unnamed protein product [Rotaria sp. Silwood2]CAF3359348.1 unnamed protein product [Rotaria sp. Silwood2]CAF3999766.1 unnamed protein product [Rotaria sp. Silwood2]